MRSSCGRLHVRRPTEEGSCCRWQISMLEILIWHETVAVQPPHQSLALSVLNKPALLLTPAEISCLDFTHKTWNTPRPDAQVRVPCVVFLFIVVRTFVLSIISASLILCKQLVCWLFDHPIWSKLKRLNTLTLVSPEYSSDLHKAPGFKCKNFSSLFTFIAQSCSIF